MNKAQAMKEARKRWGKAAHIKYDRLAFTEKQKERMKDRNPEMYKRVAFNHKCDVGRIQGIGGIQFFEIKGSGDTWDEAFVQFDRRQEAFRKEYGVSPL